MAEDIERKYETALTWFVDAKWRVSGQSQTAYMGELFKGRSGEFHEQTLSKFIRGRLAAVPKGLIEALSERYAVPVSELERMAMASARLSSETGGGDTSEEGPVLQFISGHTAWASSLLTALLTTELKADGRFRLTSRRGALDEEGLMLDWKVREGDAIPVASGELAPLSAPDVAELLEYRELEGRGLADPKEPSDPLEPMDGSVVTFGLMPWQVAIRRQSSRRSEGTYIRIATLMDSAAACSVIVPNEIHKYRGDKAGSSTLTSGALLRWLTRTGEPRCRVVLAEQGTVAGDQARRIEKLAQNWLREDGNSDIEVGWEDCSTADIQNKTWSDLSTVGGEVQAILTWDPQATRLVRRSQGAGLQRYNFINVHGLESNLVHNTFDIVLYVSDVARTAPEFAAWRRSARLAYRDLMMTILPKIQIAQDSLVSDTSDRRSLDLLRDYFHEALDGFKMSRDDVIRMLTNIHFSAGIDPSGMAEINRLGELD